MTLVNLATDPAGVGPDSGGIGTGRGPPGEKALTSGAIRPYPTDTGRHYDGAMTGEETLGIVELFVAFIAAAAVVGVVVRRFLPVPYTVALVVFGLAAVLVAPRLEFVVTPELVLLVLLPGLVFEAAYQLDVTELRRSFGGILILAAPGVVIAALIVAVVLYLATGLPLELGFVVGAMVGATDPASVVATFKALGSPARLRTMVEGESLFNDGTALVVFAIAIAAVQTGFDLGGAVTAFIATIAGSIAIGLVVGFLASRIIATVDDHLIESTISLATAYGAYIAADRLHESGVIATVIAGVVVGTYGRRIGMSRATQQALDTVWEFIAFLLTALVFLLVGLSISLPDLVDALPTIAWAVLAILAGRALVVYVLVGGTSRVISDRYHRAIPLPWLNVMFWAGLRGAVTVAMALSLPLDFPMRGLLQETAFGVVLFTLLVQGTTIGRLIRRTGSSDDADVARLAETPMEP
jgi:CPA1 family monovalent cation:H+ antiporter